MNHTAKHYSTLIPAALLLLMLLGSCQQRYWYRVKLNLGQTKVKGSFAVEVENQSPGNLSPAFEKAMTETCSKSLSKKGLTPVKTGTPDYTFKLVVRVDSFNTSGIAYRMEKEARVDPYAYQRSNVKAIMLNYKMYKSKTMEKLWESENDLYYFANENRDRRRTKGMVKYTIRKGYQ